MLKRFINILILICFVSGFISPFSYAQILPSVSENLILNSPIEPLLMKGLSLHPENPFRFDFIVDLGQSGFSQEKAKNESQRLISYFLAALTIPKGDIWVNLSPYEKKRIIPDSLSQTELGRDMLNQDYVLKQMTSALMNPNTRLGADFWERIYKIQSRDPRFRGKNNSFEIPQGILNKVWIVPEKATVYENGLNAYVIDSHLKVLMDQDYEGNKIKDIKNANITSPVMSQLMKQIILPAIEKEVNEGNNFIQIRQIFYSLILAKWYKQRIVDGVLARLYFDKNKTKGIDPVDRAETQTIYNLYLEKYQKGSFGFIKEEYDPVSQQLIPRKYFSGGIDKTMDFAMNIKHSSAQIAPQGRLLRIEANVLNSAGLPDRAMVSGIPKVFEYPEVQEAFYPIFYELILERNKGEIPQTILTDLNAVVSELVVRFKARLLKMGVLSKFAEQITEEHVRNFLVNEEGFPFVENRRPGINQIEIQTGTSGRNEGVAIGEAVWYSGEGMEDGLRYPIYQPFDTESEIKMKIVEKQQYFEKIFQLLLKRRPVHSDTLQLMLEESKQYVLQRLEENPSFAYRAVISLRNKNFTELEKFFQKRLNEKGESLQFENEERKKVTFRILKIFYSRLVEDLLAHRDIGIKEAKEERFQYLRAAAARVLNNAYGTKMDRYSKLISDYLKAKQNLDLNPTAENVVRFRLSNEDLIMLDKSIDEEQKGALLQRTWFMYDHVVVKLLKEMEGEKPTGVRPAMAPFSAHEFLKRYRRHIQTNLSQLKAINKPFLRSSIDNLEEQMASLPFIENRIHSQHYVFSPGTTSERAEVLIEAQKNRFEEALHNAWNKFLLNRLRSQKKNGESIGSKFIEYFKTPDAEKLGFLKKFADENEDFIYLRDLFARFIKEKISKQALTIEEAIASFLAAINANMPLEENFSLEDVERINIFKGESHKNFDDLIFELSIFTYKESSASSKKITDKPVVIVVDPSVKEVTYNGLAQLKEKYPNIVGLIWNRGTPSAHAPKDIKTQGGVAITGVENYGGKTYNIKKGDKVILYGKWRGTGQPRIVIKPNWQEMYEGLQEMHRHGIKRKFNQIKTKNPLNVDGHYLFTSPVDVHETKSEILEGKALREGGTGVGLSRIEVIFKEYIERYPDIEENEKIMTAIFTEILSANMFQNDLKGVSFLWTPRLYDVQKDKIPKILSDYIGTRGDDADAVLQDILNNYPGIAFYFYKDKKGNMPFYEFGLRQLRCLNRAYLKVNNGKLGISFPNVRNDEKVSLDKIDEMLKQSQTAVIEEQMSAYVKEHQIQKRALNLREIDNEENRLNALLKQIQIGYYFEDITALSQFEHIVQRSNFIDIGSSDLIKSMFHIDRSDPKYGEYYSQIRPEVVEVFWILVQITRKYQVPLLISGDLGSSFKVASLALALGNEYKTEVYTVPSVDDVARQRTYLGYALTMGGENSLFRQLPFKNIFMELEKIYSEELKDGNFSNVKYYMVKRITELIEAISDMQLTIEDKIDQDIEAEFFSDEAMVTSSVGGIDMNELNVRRAGNITEIKYDTSQIQMFMKDGINGLTPVIINVTPVNNLLLELENGV
ncbi:MAG: hypothetical protein HQL26_01800 [Candidatus Omnitrophica bacterium]|nr:hypothetical protein [Candidatus Omnitrophota bacterium]